MNLSVLDIFKVGVGPSSSHTMGPMNAAQAFASDLEARGLLERTAKVAAQVYGSLALTGRGHCTDRAILLGLEGNRPETLDPAAVEPALERIRRAGRLRLLGRHEIAFDEPLDLLFHRDQTLPQHPNGMRFTALDAAGAVLHREEYYSTGGGFIVRAAEFGKERDDGAHVALPHPFDSARELLEMAREAGLELHELVLQNERAYRPDRRDANGAARHLVGHERLHRAWIREHGPAARRAEGEAARLAHAPPAARVVRATHPGRDGLGQCIRARGQRGERGRRPCRHRADQRRGGHRAGGDCVTTGASSRARARTASCVSC